MSYFFLLYYDSYYLLSQDFYYDCYEFYEYLSHDFYYDCYYIVYNVPLHHVMR